MNEEQATQSALLEEENKQLKQKIAEIQQFNIDLTKKYSETISMFDDGIYMLSSIKHQRKLDKILEFSNETSTNSV